jgi:tetratricopeptide (TPR) repeat protein
VKNNPYITKIHPIASYLAQEDGVIDSRDAGGYHTGYYRPIINVTYWIDHKLWGMRASGFRATNLIVHLLSCFLLFKLLHLLINDRQACLLATILFALHPVNTESVSWIASRNNILVTLFALSAFHFYIRGWKNDSLKAMCFSVLFFMLAILSKEFGLMVLPVLFLYQRLLSGERRNILQELTGYFVFIVIIVLYLILRKTATSALLTPSQMGNIGQRVYFLPYLIWENLRLILFPYGLHSFSIDYPKNFMDWQATAGFLSCILLGVFIWKGWNDKVVVFSVLSFLMSTVPILNLIPTSAVSLISMRWLYFPMIFILLAVARFIQKGIQLSRFVTLACVSLVTIYLGIYSYVLNKNLWHDESTFFDREVLRFNNYLYAGGFAENLLEEKKYLDAERYFRIAINNHPQKVRNHINYSALLIDTGRAEGALLCLNRAKPLAMTYDEKGQWFNNMGMAYFNLGKKGEALRNFKKAIIFSPEEPQFWANLGGTYGSIGDYENSVFVLKKGLDIAPDSIPLRKNLAVTYLRMDNPEKAICVLEEIRPDKGAGRGIAELLNKASRALESKRHVE